MVKLKSVLFLFEHTECRKGYKTGQSRAADDRAAAARGGCAVRAALRCGIAVGGRGVLGRCRSGGSGGFVGIGRHGGQFFNRLGLGFTAGTSEGLDALCLDGGFNRDHAVIPFVFGQFCDCFGLGLAARTSEGFHALGQVRGGGGDFAVVILMQLQGVFYAPIIGFGN